MKFNKFYIVLLVNLIIASGFFIDGLHSNATDISGDLGNILPICIKKDNPELFAGDTYLDDVNNVKYYTPFFVESLEFFANFSGGNYIQALNIFGFLTHFIYGITWFLLFYKLRKDFWAALLFSVLFRGILWPPGAELLGISELWTIMPRTVFGALLPIPFLIYQTKWKYKRYIAAFTLGLFANFHAISGVGAALVYGLIMIAHDYYQNRKVSRKMIIDWLLSGIAFVFGLLPFVLSYLFNVMDKAPVDSTLLKLGFAERLSDLFWDPVLFVSLWSRPATYFFGILFIIYFIIDRKNEIRYSRYLLLGIITLFVTANGSVYLEQFINKIFGTELIMSFQFIRFQKYILILLQIGAFLLLCECYQRFKLHSRFKAIIFGLTILLLMVCKHPSFKIIPFLGDDICTGILPNSLSIVKKPFLPNKVDRQAMYTYINENLPITAVFYGDPIIRTATKRSVFLDNKGAGMLIEGNRAKFIQWYQDFTYFNTQNPQGKVAFLQSKGVTHIMMETEFEGDIIPVKQIGKYRLYDITKGVVN